MKKITVLILALSFTISSIAQISITGIVSNDSIPLESASVIIKNTKKGVATNQKGKFKLEVKKGDTLSISYLGYETKELVVDQSYYLKVKLKEGGKLNEVIVNAYGHTRKVSCGVCYSVSRCGICSEDIIESKEIFYSDSLKLYPNPSSNGIFQLKLTEDYEEVKISVANINGQIIQNPAHQEFGEKLTIDLSEFSTGIYIINIIADGKRLEAIKAIRS